MLKKEMYRNFYFADISTNKFAVALMTWGYAAFGSFARDRRDQYLDLCKGKLLIESNVYELEVCIMIWMDST